MYTICLSPKAYSDIKKIKNYIEQDLDNPIASKNFGLEVYKKIENLKDFPLIGKPLQAGISIPTDYRFLPVGNHLIFYRVNEKNVYSTRVLYGKSDYMKILFKD